MSAYKIKIESIECVHQKDEIGASEIWLLALSDGTTPSRYPVDPMSTYSIDDGETWSIDGDLELEFDGCCNLTIYEQDKKLVLSTTDFLGCVYFTASSDPNTQLVATNGTDSGESDYSEFRITFSWAS